MAWESQQIRPWIVPCLQSLVSFPELCSFCFQCVITYESVTGSHDEWCPPFHVPRLAVGVDGVSTHLVMLRLHKTFMKDVEV